MIIATAVAAVTLTGCGKSGPLRIGFLGGLSGRMADLGVAGLGGAVFLLLAWRLFRSHAGEAADPRNDDGLYDVRAGARDARNLFAFSILYLTLMFATLLGEHLAGAGIDR